MNLADERLKQLDNSSLTADGRILLRCRVAADYTGRGQYEAAREVLGELWPGVSARPKVEGLTETTAAEVLLQCGALTGWLGSAEQARGAQDAAKDLLSEALRIFEGVGLASRVAAAQSELGVCYWREGSLDEARIIQREAYCGLDESETEQKTQVLVRRTLTEISAGRYHDALHLLNEAENLFRVASDALKGRWHGQMALVMRRLGTAEGRADYLDRAIVEYTAAIYHYEQAQHERFSATNRNNLAFLFYKLGRYADAHEHLDHARAVLARLNDAGLVAQVDETRARILIAEQRYREANRVIAAAVLTLERGGESALLADALTVQGIAWARLEVYDGSINVLRRAADVAEQVGALTNAGLAALTLIEEHGASWRLHPNEIYEAYARADALLRDTQDSEHVARLRECARVVMRRLAGSRLHDEDFTLYKAVCELEGKLIEQALDEAGGSVTKAARLLGMPYQSLSTMLNGRHRRLRRKRTPWKSRLRSIIKSRR